MPRTNKGREKHPRQTATHDLDRDLQVPVDASEDVNAPPQPADNASDSVSLLAWLRRNVRVSLQATGRNAVLIVIVLSLAAVTIWGSEAVALPAIVVLGGAFLALASQPQH